MNSRFLLICWITGFSIAAIAQENSERKFSFKANLSLCASWHTYTVADSFALYARDSMRIPYDKVGISGKIGFTSLYKVNDYSALFLSLQWLNYRYAQEKPDQYVDPPIPGQVKALLPGGTFFSNYYYLQVSPGVEYSTKKGWYANIRANVNIPILIISGSKRGKLSDYRTVTRYVNKTKGRLTAVSPEIQLGKKFQLWKQEVSVYIGYQRFLMPIFDTPLKEYPMIWDLGIAYHFK